MKLTVVMRPDGNLFRGGAELMIERTQQAFATLGVDTEVLTPLTRELGDAVLFVGCYDSHWSTASLALDRGVPYVCMPIFSSNLAESGERWRGTRQRVVGRFPRLQRKVFTHAKALIVTTNREKRRMQAYFKLAESRFEVIPHGVDARFASGDPKAFRSHFGIEEEFILHCGAYSETKNQLNLIRAMKGSGVHVAFAGGVMDAAYFARCKQEADEGFRFLEAIPSESDLMPSAYAAARAFVLPSYNEAFSLAVLEAAVARCSLVLGKRWEPEEIYGEDARYVDPDDVPEIRAKATEAFREGKRPSEVAEKYLRRYSWEDATGRIKVLIEDVLAE